MSPRNTAKADIVLKNFWKDNAHFADLFNAVLFDGEQKLHPEDLREADVDLSSVLKFNGHIETIQRLRDVVKKTAYGMDFVIWGIENQQKIHYAMPLRHMIMKLQKRIWMKRPQIQKMNFYPDSKKQTGCIL